MRSFAIRLLVVALLAPVAASAQSHDAASLLALHHQYVGWQFGDGTFTSMRMSGSVDNTKPWPGRTPEPPTPITRLVRGAQFRDTQTDVETGRRYNTGFTGRVFWESDDNGFTHPIIGDAEKYDVATSFLFNEGTAALTGTLQDPVTINGTSYPVVRVTPPAGFSLDIAVDPKTGAYVQAVVDAGGSYDTTIDILSYAYALPGKRVISSFRAHDSHYTANYTSFQPNAPIADEELHPPPQTATWTFANSNPFPIQSHGDEILVLATINGVTGTFLLDTGASSILLTSDFARRAHVRRAERSEISGIGGSASAEADVLDSLVIGGNTLSNVIAISASLGNDYMGLLGGYNGQRVDGLLGYTLLGGAIVKLNLGAQTMTLLDPQVADLSQESGVLLDVDLSGGQPMVPMTLDGSIPVNAVLDSGDAAGIGYSPTFVRKHHLTVLRSAGGLEGVGGGESTYCGMFGKLEIGTIVYEGAGACQTGALTGDYLLVGIDFLKHFNMVFDYPRGQMILEPLPE